MPPSYMYPPMDLSQNPGMGLNFGMPVTATSMPAPNSSTMGQFGQTTGTPLFAQKGAMDNLLPPAAKAGMAGAAGGNWFDKIGGLEGIGSIAQALGSIGQVYAAIKGVGLAKDQLNFSKEAYRTNLNNQTQTYNTSLEDRISARYHMEGKDSNQAEAYLSKHKL